MPVTVKLKDLRRALDVTANVARSGLEYWYQDILKYVHIKRTKAGLIVEATDRFVMIRAHVPVESAKGKLPEILLQPRAITKMLSMLTEGYPEVKRRDQDELDVTIAADPERGLATFEVQGFPVSIPMADKGMYPGLDSALKASSGGFSRDKPLDLNPVIVDKVLRVHKHGSPGDSLRFTDTEDGKKSGIVKFYYSDWLIGALMPVRNQGELPSDSWALGDS